MAISIQSGDAPIPKIPRARKPSPAEKGAAILDAAAALKKAKGPKFPRVWLDDATPAIEADYLLKGIVERGKLCVIYGPAGDGKTFFMGDMAGHIAAEIPWRGRRVRSGLVVYVAAEAGASILRRFFAWREHRLGEAREGRIPLAIITRGVNLLNMTEVEALLVELRAIAAEIGLPLALVIFDTLSRSIPGGDENRSEDMTRVIEACDAIRDELGAATAIVHHSGKDSTKGARGHSSLFGAADTVISVVERVAVVEKSRDGVQGDQFPFALDVVDLGTDADGDAVTTCIVRPLDGAKKSPRKKLTADEQIALDALREVCEPLPGTTVIPTGKVGATVEKWRRTFYARLGESREVEQDAKRQAFNRGKKGLIAKQVVGAWESFAWIC
jgi:KaiC/GvpD/RAD55 family RecA-like ATPase